VFANDYRNPVMFAKEIATLDLLPTDGSTSDSGTGWYEPDYAIDGSAPRPTGHAVRASRRGRPLLKRLWTEERVDHTGAALSDSRRHGAAPPRAAPAHRPPSLARRAQRCCVSRAATPTSSRTCSRANDRGALDPSEITEAALDEKLGIVRAAAGARYDDITLNLPRGHRAHGQREESIRRSGREGGRPQRALAGEPVLRVRLERRPSASGYSRCESDSAQPSIAFARRTRKRFAPLVASLRGT
jgi:alkanesulfonate monooxygenase SsuD/methylene tetrahydromethanopterin reductase-like flavin-dependent oxidoreductase (luciferase family)